MKNHLASVEIVALEFQIPLQARIALVVFFERLNLDLATKMKTGIHTKASGPTLPAPQKHR